MSSVLCVLYQLMTSFPPVCHPQVTGIEGNFRRTCNSVMRVLHENKDSVMAVLEAFVYDPLLNWRLIDGGWGMYLSSGMSVHVT